MAEPIATHRCSQPDRPNMLLMLALLQCVNASSAVSGLRKAENAQCGILVTIHVPPAQLRIVT